MRKVLVPIIIWAGSMAVGFIGYSVVLEFIPLEASWNTVYVIVYGVFIWTVLYLATHEEVLE